MEEFTVIIPIFSETNSLKLLNFYFNLVDLKPLYVLDSKKISRRDEVENIVGPVAIYDNPGKYIEAHYDRLAELSPTDWILRIDCDEVPNSAMLQHCLRFVRQSVGAYCGFDRDDLSWRGNHFERISYPPLFFDSQFRLFNRRKVKFTSKIHTPGFRVPPWKLPLVPFWHAPLNARIYHLQREFVSNEENLEKQRRYSEAGQDAKFFQAMMRPPKKLRWRSFDDGAFTALFAAWKSSNSQEHAEILGKLTPAP